MTAGTTSTSLSQRALYQIGGKSTVSSIFPSDGSAASNACNVLFVPTFQALARSAWWNCLSRQFTLSLIGAAPETPEGGANGFGILPPQPWLYLYQVPSDCLKSRAIVPTFPLQGVGVPLTTINNGAPIWLPGFGQIPFKVMYNVDANNNPIETIVTNQSQAQLIYTTNQQNPVVWDSQFEAAFVASLAAFLVPALSMQLSLMQMQVGIAEKIIAEARASDGNEGSNTQDHVPDWIRARSGGSGGWYGNNYGYGGGYESMCWPAG